MSSFSRWMPRAEPRAHSAVRYGVLVVLVAGAAWVVLHYPWTLPAAAGVVGFSLLADRGRGRRLRDPSSRRTGESLCTFARAFPRDERDAWVLRAVWQELQPYCVFRGGTMPLRPTDRLREDLEIDPEDLEYDVIMIAARTGRDLINYKANPFYGRLQTVGDLVRFFQAQPRRVVT